MRTRFLTPPIVVLTIIALCLYAPCVFAQTTSATLAGVVRDATGAVVPQAKITLKNITKGSTRTTITDAAALNARATRRGSVS